MNYLFNFWVFDVGFSDNFKNLLFILFDVVFQIKGIMKGTSIHVQDKGLSLIVDWLHD